MPPVLSVPVFGGGVVLEGSADAQRTDELSACDSYDIGPRGQLVAASDLTGAFNAQNGGGSNLTKLFGLAAMPIPTAVDRLIAVGDEGINTYATTTDVLGVAAAVAFTAGTIIADGLIVSTALFPYVKGGVQVWLALVAMAARSAQNARHGLGLRAILTDGTGTPIEGLPMSYYDALGTGPKGEDAIGGANLAKALHPRGVLAYNGHAIIYGFDDADATTGNGPNRVMFSNLGKPLKWGNDPTPGSGVNRSFTDSDAILIGGAGTVIRCGYVWNGRAWFATNAGLYYLEGFGRDSFLTNGAVAMRQSRNAIGQHAMIEGPDGLLYGVSEEGLWVFDGGNVDPIGNTLRNFATKSPGWWDLIWTTTPAPGAAYPGTTNQDLVWMMSDPDTQQVWVGIPFCSASNGYGYGTDTVVIKYHVRTGGFTRQVFTGKIITSGVDYRRSAATPAKRLLATPGATNNISLYAAKATPATSPILPTALPDVTFGEYAPFGPDGVGVMRKRYLTLSWEAASALPLVFTLTPTIDGQAMPAVTLTIGTAQPGAPSNGDLWVDTSGTDTNLGNGTAGAIVPANAADYIIRRYVATWAAWRQVPGGGQQGTRVTLPVAFDPRRGTRFKVRMQCTSAAGRWQIEGFAEKPNPVGNL